MSDTAQTYDLLVIGGGAAGMLAAGTAAARGRKVLLLEKNAVLGKKLSITGGGRCNITNAEFDTRTLLKNYGDAEKFLHSPFSQYSVQHTFDFFTSEGLDLVVQGHKRAFPASHKAPDVTATLARYIEKKGVTTKLTSPVTNLEVADGIFVATCGTVQYRARACIVATGGTSHPETGSTGDAFPWLAAFGHTIIPSTPNLVPLKVKDEWVKKLAGNILPDIKISFYADGTRAFSKRGRVLLTHFGLSGPLILNTASEVQDLFSAGDVTARVDLFPDLDLGALDDTVVASIDEHKNKDFKNVIDALVPAGMGRTIAELFAHADPAIKAHSLTKDERKRFVRLVKALPISIEGLMGFDRAIVSDGGVPLTEIDTKTFESRKVPRLYIIGDALHINRPSGGYSLQLCWTSGHVAGSHA
jgi:hypothetical protein